MTEREGNRPVGYAIYGDHGAEYKRAKDCIAATYDEAVTLDTAMTGDRFAEVVLARLVALYPPMLVVALEEIVNIDDTTPMRDYIPEDEIEEHRAGDDDGEGSDDASEGGQL